MSILIETLCNLRTVMEMPLVSVVLWQACTKGILPDQIVPPAEIGHSKHITDHSNAPESLKPINYVIVRNLFKKGFLYNKIYIFSRLLKVNEQNI